MTPIRFLRSLRADYGVPLQKIKEAIRNARDHYEIEHPFARKDHRTVLVGKDLHIFLKEDGENPVGLTGKDLGQKSMKPCIEAYMKDDWMTGRRELPTANGSQPSARTLRGSSSPRTRTSATCRLIPASESPARNPPDRPAV